ncbi:MAG: hypothetical protein RIQ89_503 [Bacteroidota bacterium]|jgi:2-oxoglutarate dehydrogenase E2 component (dihydrolipoamide succinyltransferase)
MIEMKVPSPGESITEVQIARWVKKEGDYVEKDEELAEIDSDKATLTLNATAAGVIKILVAEGATVAVGATVCQIDETAPKPTGRIEKGTTAAPQHQVEKSVVAVAMPAKSKNEEVGKSAMASVAAAKMIREAGIDSQSITGNGKGGRITKADVLNFNSLNGTTAISRTAKREKMTMLRKKVSQRLVAVKQETAMLTTFNEVDMSSIMNIRKQYKDQFKEKHGVGLGFMSFFTKAVCEALKLYPAVNAMIDGDEIQYHNYCDIGIAVSAPKGLMVPVIRNAEGLSLAGIESAIITLATKARDNKLSVEEMTGGTFTITNGGVFGSMLSTPIINPPQSAILGMHNIVDRPVALNGEVVIRPIMYVALSYDHRIIDGRESVGFLVKVKQMLEDPAKLLTAGEDLNKKILGL